MDRSSYVGIFEFLDSPFEQKFSDLDEFDFSYEIFNYYDTEFVPAKSISSIDIFFSSKVDITNSKPLGLGTIESSFVDSALTMPFVEDSKVACVSAKVTCIKCFLLNMILMLLFLGDIFLVVFTIFYWLHLVVQDVTSFACTMLMLMSLMSASTLLARCISPYLCSCHRSSLYHLTFPT